jgi:hypothetical protein
MPAITRVVLYDDKAWPDRIEAQEVVRLSLHWQSVTGEEHGRQDVELYLVTDSREELAKELAAWFEVGHKPGGLPAGEVEGAELKRTKGMRAGPLTGSGSSERRDWKRDLRAWSDGLNLVNRHDQVHPAWQTTTGKNYYPVALERAFELHEQGGHDGEVAQLIAQFQPRKDEVA